MVKQKNIGKQLATKQNWGKMAHRKYNNTQKLKKIHK